MALLHWVDWVIFALIIAATLAIGIYHAYASRRKQTTSEYLTGGRQLKLLPVTLSMNASFFSGIMIIGVPAENYAYGGAFFYSVIGHWIGATLSALIFVPVFHPLELTSVNDYLKMRYESRFVAVLGTLAGVTSMCLYTASVYFAPATALDLVTGFPAWASILLGTVITVIYTSLGGIKGVIWTDVFQALLMMVGLLMIGITAALKVGGLAEVGKECAKWGRLNFDSFDPDPRTRLTFWGLTLGTMSFSLIRYGTDQAAVQRYCSLPTLNKARLCVLGILPWTFLSFGLTTLSGLTIFAFYSKLGCDPIRGEFIANSNQLISRFMLDAMNYPAIHGILLASIVAGSLSTASSNLNSSAANIWKDIVHAKWPNLSERRNLIITRILVVSVGVLTMVLGFAASVIGGTVIQMSITFISACGAPAMTMFLLGVFLPFINWIGAAAGGFAGFIFALWLGFGGYTININTRLPTTVANCSAYADAYSLTSALTTTSTVYPTSTMMTTTILDADPEVSPLVRNFYTLSYLWIALFTSFVTIIVGILISLLTGGLQNKVPKSLLHPWVRGFWGTEDKSEDLVMEEKKGDVMTKKVDMEDSECFDEDGKIYLDYKANADLAQFTRL